MKTAVVCGAGGFIASHLVKRLKDEGYWVRGVDRKEPEFAPTAADEFRVLDLRDLDQARAAVAPGGRGPIGEVYQLAAEMGGMGFISTAECEILRHSALINVNVPQAAVETRVPRYFFSSSVCVYRDMTVGEPPLDEDAILAAAKILGAAKNPMIVVGGGALGASREVTRLANMLQAPVVAWRRGRGVVDDRNPLSIPLPLAHEMWREVDVVIGIGTRLLMQLGGWGHDPHLKVVRIDADPDEVERIGRPAAAIIGDSAHAVRGIDLARGTAAVRY